MTKLPTIERIDSAHWKVNETVFLNELEAQCCAFMTYITDVLTPGAEDGMLSVVDAAHHLGCNVANVAYACERYHRALSRISLSEMLHGESND